LDRSQNVRRCPEQQVSCRKEETARRVEGKTDCKRKNAQRKAGCTYGENGLNAEFEGKGKEFIQQNELSESEWNAADAGIFQLKFLIETNQEKLQLPGAKVEQL
jgi:hypothetical protein